MVAHSEYQWINPAIVMSILHRMTGTVHIPPECHYPGGTLRQ